MSGIGNKFGQRNERVTLKDYNDAWAAQRRKGIERTQMLSQQIQSSVFQTAVTVSQQQTYNAFQGSAISTASALSRLNLLV
ncbi:hypothetical protein [Pannonibacter tanglangensis]|nr:hypothetical protein [Pannonibacter sp. XCT-34]NBN63220.1 hypothetical protein [Pannonibacter sp. XCT-34]